MQPSVDLSLSTYSSRRTDTTMSSVYHHLTSTNAPGTKSRAEKEDSLHSKSTSVSSVTPSRPSSFANTDRHPPASNNKSILEKFPETPTTKQTIPLSNPSLCPSELLPHFPTLHSLPSSYLLSLPPHHHWKISKFFPLLSSDAHAVLLLRRKEVVLSEILRGVLGMAARLLQRDPHGSVSRWS